MSEESETQNSSESETETQETEEQSEVESEEQKTLTGDPEEESQEEVEEVSPLTNEDIEIPEGLEVQDEFRDKFLEVVNDPEMSPKDRAQALINLQGEVMTKAAEASSQQFETQQKEWQDEVKADPELGGGNFQKTLGNIHRLVDQYGSDELVSVMANTGAGNNIHVIRFLNSLAPMIKEGEPETGQPANSEASRAQKLYPSMKG